MDNIIYKKAFSVASLEWGIADPELEWLEGGMIRG